MVFRVFLLCLMVSLSLAACKPQTNNANTAGGDQPLASKALLESPEKIEEKLPAFDIRKEQVYKLGGRYFIVPSEYAGDNDLTFFWVNGRSLSRNDGAQLDKTPGYRKQDVIMWMKSIDTSDDRERYKFASTRQYMELYEKKGWLKPAVELFPGVIRRDIASSENPQDYRAFCIAKDSLALDKKPAVIGCPGSASPVPFHTVGTSFMWKHQIRIAVSFNVSHLRDWPQINSEVIRILGLVKEVEK